MPPADPFRCLATTCRHQNPCRRLLQEIESLFAAVSDEDQLRNVCPFRSSPLLPLACQLASVPYPLRARGAQLGTPICPLTSHAMQLLNKVINRIPNLLVGPEEGVLVGCLGHR